MARSWIVKVNINKYPFFSVLLSHVRGYLSLEMMMLFDRTLALVRSLPLGAGVAVIHIHYEIHIFQYYLWVSHAGGSHCSV